MQRGKISQKRSDKDHKIDNELNSIKNILLNCTKVTEHQKYIVRGQFARMPTKIFLFSKTTEMND